MPKKNLIFDLDQIKFIGFLVAIMGTGFGNSFCGVGLGIYLVSLVLQLISKKKDTLPVFPQIKFFIPLILSFLISVFISHYFSTSLRGFGKYLQGFALLYAALDTVKDRQRLSWAVGALIVVFVVGALDGIWQYFTGFDFVRGREPILQEFRQVTGPLKHYNDFGTFLLPSFSIITALLFFSFRERKYYLSLACAVCMALSVWAMTLTLSRSAILASFFSLFIFCLFFRFRWVAFGSIMIIFILIWVTPSMFSLRLHQMVSLHQSSAPERILILKTTLRMIESHPFFGLGLNTYSEYFKLFKPQNYAGLMYAHNSFAQIAAEAGLVGLFSYLVFIASLLASAIKKAITNQDLLMQTLAIGFISAVAGILFNAVFESLLQSTQLRTLFWVLLGLALAAATSSTRSGNSPR